MSATVPTPAVAPEAPTFTPLCQGERVRMHSLSNIAFGVAIVVWVGFGLWMYSLEKQMRGNRAVQQALLAAVDGTGQKIIVCDEHGLITMASPDADELFGVALLGHHVHDFCLDPTMRMRANSAFTRIVTSVRRSGKPIVLTLDHIVVDIGGPPRQFVLHIRLYESEGRVHIVTTITPKEVTQTLFIPGQPAAVTKP